MMNYLLSFLQLVLNLNTRPFVIKCAKLSGKTPIMKTKSEDMNNIFYDEMTKGLRHETLYCKFNDYLIFTFEEPYIQSRTF